jgi:hypothetical protein
MLVNSLVLETVWSGATIGFVHDWSHSRGELMRGRLQRRRPLGADPLAAWPEREASQAVKVTRPRAVLDDDDDGL